MCTLTKLFAYFLIKYFLIFMLIFLYIRKFLKVLSQGKQRNTILKDSESKKTQLFCKNDIDQRQLHTVFSIKQKNEQKIL